ncbi:hypothetical protein NDU88_003804 [Pleurodeles waltl]|uniref:Uncharacterized protein n=1 Tax=Pleurodeles waltl TaxID=8319 RepID=A0AAV7M544_PLEWA|nr:hypothetical protein NDU88_003804 [Pleurodeles waltl]
MEDRSRRDNIRLLGIPENEEGADMKNQRQQGLDARSAIVALLSAGEFNQPQTRFKCGGWRVKSEQGLTGTLTRWPGAIERFARLKSLEETLRESERAKERPLVDPT